MPQFTPFTVRVPATTANLGSGFDAIGMALDLWNEVRVSVADSPSVEVRGAGAETLPSTARNLMYRAAVFGAQHLGNELPPLRLEADNRVPLTRGLGSSAAAVVAGILIADRIGGGQAEPDRLIVPAARMEGHPDNAAPALYGGACLVVNADDDTPVVRQLPFPRSLTCVAFIPDAPLSTQKARSALPHEVPLADAAFNLGRAALLARAFLTQEWDDLALATEDRLHQPYRAPLVPGLESLMESAREAGAYAAFLSGAGPTVMALVSHEHANQVSRAVSDRARELEVAGSVVTVAPSERGAHVVDG